MTDPDPIAAVNAAADVPVRELLEQFWIRAKRPTAEQMAAKHHLPVEPLAGFLGSTGVPSLDETTAMARAVAPRAWQDVVIQRWHDAHRRRGSEPALPLPRRSTPPDATTAIDAAMAATTHREFAEALELLKEEHALTYEQIAKNSGHVVSKSAAHRFASRGRSDKQEFVEAFVRACGVHSLDLDLWLTAWRSVNQHSRAPAADATETRLAEPATPASAPPISEQEAEPAAAADDASRLRLIGMLAATSVAGTATAAVRLCRTDAAQRWLMLLGLSAAGAALLLLAAEIHDHLSSSRCTKPHCPSSPN